MSALRLSDYRTGEVRLVDLGPGVATGRVHDGGRLCRPDPVPARFRPEPKSPPEKLEQWRRSSAAYRARKRALGGDAA